jgi:dTMP kinase
MERINTLAMWVQDGLKPDVTFLLDAPANIGMERAQKRGAVDRMESEQMSFFERAREGYLKLARAEPERFAVIDASQSLAAVKVDIEQKIRQLLTEYSH